MKWLYCTRGSVSIYFMIILGVLFLFGSVCIDFARIRTAELRHQSTVQAAARSLHSSYDIELQRYGLYGLNPDSAAQIYESVLLRNLASPGVMNQRGNWIELEHDEDSVTMKFAQTLAEHAVFKQQILEEMKYRAPIEYMFGIYDKLRKTTTLEMVQESSILSDKLKSLEDLIEKREQALNAAWDQIASLAGPNGYVQLAYEQNRSSLSRMEQLAEQLKSETAASLEESISKLEMAIENTLRRITRVAERLVIVEDIEDEQLRNQEKSKLEDERSMLERELSENRSALDSLKKLLQIALDFIAEIGKHQASLHIQNVELSRRIERIKQDLDESRNWNQQLREQISSLDEEFHDSVPILTPAYYDQLLTGVGTIVSLHHGYVRQFDILQLLSGEDFNAHKDQLNRMNQAFMQEATRFFNKHEAEERRRQELRQSALQQQEDAKNQAKGVLDQVMNGITNCAPGSELTLMRIGELEDHYLSLNRLVKDEADGASDLIADPERTAARARSFMERIQGALLAIRDGVYLNEYALTKFNYRTLEQSFELSDPHLHPLARQEAEYILYGFSSCYLNQSAAYGEIFLVRLSIRVMEQLTQPKKSILAVGSPWLVFLMALAEGAYEAYQDVQKLVAGEEVEVSAHLSNRFTMNYKDYLRLFMLLHGREVSMMARMQALVQFNTGVDLSERSTYANISSASWMKPWFIPDTARVLGKRIEQGKLQIQTETVFAY